MSDEATKLRAATLIARSKGSLAVGGMAAGALQRVSQTWPNEHRACVLGIEDERERCARIVQALVGGANGPETDAILTTVAEAIRSGNCVED